MWTWNQENQDCMAFISDTLLSLNLFIGDKSYEVKLKDLISDKQVIFRDGENLIKLPDEIYHSIMKEARIALETGLKLREPPPNGWVCIDKCSVCSEWKNEMHEDHSTTSMVTDDRFPETTDQLILIKGSRSGNPPEIRRCPSCGTYYKIINIYEWTTIGDDDDDYMTRLTPNEAILLLPEEEKNELLSRWEPLMDCLNSCRNSLNKEIADYARRSIKKNN